MHYDRLAAQNFKKQRPAHLNVGGPLFLEIQIIDRMSAVPDNMIAGNAQDRHTAELRA